jgi:hypothetical protein
VQFYITKNTIALHPANVGRKGVNMNRVSQNNKILHHLQDKRTITSMEAIQEYGITRLSGRIVDLKEQGYPIAKTMVNVKNRFGEECRVAKYMLVGEQDA